MGSREQEFEQVAMPHARSLLRFARRLLNSSSAADDLVQETLMLAWRGFRQFEPGTNARAWLFRILVNTHNAQARKRRIPMVLLHRGVEPGSPPHFETLDTLRALRLLPTDQQTVLLLAVIEGFTCREIAEILKIPIGTVMSRLSRAREAMRQALAPGMPEQREKVAR